MYKKCCLTMMSILMACSHGLFAASFPCAKAKTATEKAICDNTQLNDLDDQLGQYYTQLIKALPNDQVAQLKKAQKTWLKTRDKACVADTLCLFQHYQKRIAELDTELQQQRAALSAQGVYGVVVTESTPLNIRAGLGTDTKVIAKISKGTRLRILETLGNWYKVELSDGQAGYAAKDYIQLEATAPPPQPATTTVPVANADKWLSEAKAQGFQVLLQQDFKQSDLNKRVVIHTQSTCGSHNCGAILRGAILVQQGLTWQIESAAKKIIEVGVYGEPPAGKLIQVGTDNYGVLFEGGDIHQGYTTSYAFLIMPVGDTLQEVFSFTTGQDNSGTCDNETTELPNCYSYEATLKFVAGQNPDYFDIHAVTAGTQADEKGFVVPVNDTQRFTFTGKKYAKID